MKYCPKCQTETDRNTQGACKPCAHANSAAWRAANSIRQRTYNSAYRAANPEKVRAINAAWYVANKEKSCAYSAGFRADNPEKHRASTAAWRVANPEKLRIYNHNRRARIAGVGGKLSSELTARLFKLQRGKCACGCKQPLGADFHRDHRMPIALGGSNTDDNIQLLMAKCNLSKAAKHPVDFMQQRGFLL